MSEDVILLLNNNIEVLGVTELCTKSGWNIRDIKLVSDLESQESYCDFASHSIVIISVGPSDFPFLENSFLKHYNDGKKIIALLRSEVKNDLIQPLAHHFDGIIESSSKTDLILNTLKLVAGGCRVSSLQIRNPAIDERINRVDRAPSTLSIREIEISQQLATGLSNKEIALKLDISANTVNAHLAAIRRKLDLRNRTEIALWVQDHDSHKKNQKPEINLH